MTSASRYDAIIATFVGVLALVVSAYTAHIQRQQVRAQVLPILEYGTSNSPSIRAMVANKGVGPALIGEVVVTVDGVVVADWDAALQRLLGPGKHSYAQSAIHGRVLSAGESLDILDAEDDTGAPLVNGAPGTLGDRFNQARYRIGVEICYCSTLRDCWTLVAGGQREWATTETRRCPAPSARSFQQ